MSVPVAGMEMPTLVQLGNVKIQVFSNDHNPPHFHVVSAEFEALVSMDTLEVIRGRVSRRVLETARQWARENMEVLRDEWHRLNG
jgi:PHD/YefM family antitoxin component YafN of YafNO toxin-antitoxin module